MNYQSELEFAIESAQKAGALLIENFGRQNEPKWAAETNETNFKIEMDKKSDAFIRGRIMQSFPEDDIYSEETADVDRGRKRKWVFDPLDGTFPYTKHQNNNWGVAMGFVEDITPVVGVLYIPERDELYSAVIGEGAFCDGIPIQVSSQDKINKVSMGADGGKVIPGWFVRNSFSKLTERLESDDGVAMAYCTGCSSVPMCQVASGTPDIRLPKIGNLDAYLGGALEPYDMTAQVPIIREAGGKVTHLSGKEWYFSKYKQGDPTILAANPVLHKKLSDFLSHLIDDYYARNGFGKYK